MPNGVDNAIERVWGRRSEEMKRILILGGGFGGVYTARHLNGFKKHHEDIEVVLVSRDNFLAHDADAI